MYDILESDCSRYEVSVHIMSFMCTYVKFLVVFCEENGCLIVFSYITSDCEMK